MDDLQGMSNSQVDEYLFGQYQQAKKRWRRFTGKPVRSLRRTLRRKGKGKGKRNSYLNIDSLLQQSAYFKGKGKGGNSSGKGFGRKQNPCGRDGEPLKCSVCGSAYHLRARCPRRAEQNGGASSSSQPQRQGPSYTVEPANVGMHFAAFDSSDASWTAVTPRSVTSSRVEEPRSDAGLSAAADHRPSQSVPMPNARPNTASVHELTPDPWTQDADPWMQWLHDSSQAASNAEPPTTQGVPDRWVVPGLGDVGPRQSFREQIGLGPLSTPPPLSTAMREPGPLGAPTWFSNTQQAFAQIQATQEGRGSSSSGLRRLCGTQVQLPYLHPVGTLHCPLLVQLRQPPMSHRCLVRFMPFVLHQVIPVPQHHGRELSRARRDRCFGVLCPRARCAWEISPRVKM